VPSVGVLSWLTDPYIASFFSLASCLLKVLAKTGVLRIVDAVRNQEGLGDDSKYILV